MATYSENTFHDRTTNTWHDRTTNTFGTAYVNLYTEVYFNQIYGMALDRYWNQAYALLWPNITRYWVQLWEDQIMQYVIQTWGDAPVIMKIIHQYWWSAPNPTRYWKQEWGNAVGAVKAVHQVWSMLSEVKKYVNQTYSMTDTKVENFVNQTWDLNEYEFVQRFFHQVYSMIGNMQLDPTSDSYQTNTTAGTYDSVNYPVTLTNNDTITETWTVTFTSATEFTVTGSQTGSVGSGDTSTDFAPTNPSTGSPYFTLAAAGWGGTWAVTESLSFVTYRGGNNITFSVTINGQEVFSPNITVELDEERATIDARLQIANPNYFGLCKDENPVVVTIMNTDYHLIIREVSIQSRTHVDIYNLQCQSPVSILSANSTPLMQKEFPSDLASNIVSDLASIAGITVDWQVYHKGLLVDWVIPAGILFANNEKPLAVMRKVTEACGAAIQSLPDGNLEILHEFPDRVPDWDTSVPDYIINNLVNFESLATAKEEKPGYNTVYISDQTTAAKTWTLAEKELSSTKKEVYGWHTPWDETEVVLSHTSTDSNVSITYRGIREPDYPITPDDEGEAVDPELIEIVDGAGSVSKPIYSIVSASYGTNDNLGSITFSEDGNLTTEIKNESLLSIRYKTKYHVWEVTSTNVKDVQCVLDFVE